MDLIFKLIAWTSPPPPTGEGEGGGGQDEDLLGPPSPSSPPTEGRGDFVGVCLFNYGLLSKKTRLLDQTED
jgi:hypothetical protein